jgi:hypothetical protein
VTVTAPVGFSGQVRALLHVAAEIYVGTPAQQGVAELAVRLDGPLRVAIAGMVKAGKSTLLNALVGEELAPTDAGECTRVVWWFHDGLTYRAIIPPDPAQPDQPLFPAMMAPWTLTSKASPPMTSSASKSSGRARRCAPSP